jgi:hypothetical protein
MLAIRANDAARTASSIYNPAGELRLVIGSEASHAL